MVQLTSYVVFISLMNAVYSANILAFLGTDLNSHLRAFRPIFDALQHHHNLTLFVTNTLKVKHENITVRHTPFYSASKQLEKMKILSNPCDISTFEILYKYILHRNESHYHAVYSDEDMKNLLAGPKNYDLILLNGYGSEHYVPLSLHFDVPIITVYPSFMFPWMEVLSGNHPNWDSELNFGTAHNSDYITNRIKNFVKNSLLTNHFFTTYTQKMDKGIAPYFPQNLPTIPEIYASKNRLIFSNSHPAIGVPRSTSPLVIEVGGMHIAPPKPLSDDLENFMASAEHGVIYFSLGSVIQGEKLQPGVIEAMIEVFGRLKQKVLWKWTDHIENLPDNVMLGKWLPQQDVLRHNNTILFITHGGRMSIIESLYAGVPVLVTPVILDQPSHGRMAEKQEYGLSLSFCEFNKRTFEEKITELIKNPKYKNKAEQISEVMKFDVQNINEKINFWVDFVIKNYKKSNFKVSKEIYWLQVVPSDILIVVLLTVISLIICTYYFCIFISKIRFLQFSKIKKS